MTYFELARFKGSPFKVYRMETGDNTKRVLEGNGWDGYNYSIVGRRGRCGLVLRAVTPAGSWYSEPIFTGRDKSLSWR